VYGRRSQQLCNKQNTKYTCKVYIWLTKCDAITWCSSTTGSGGTSFFFTLDSLLQNAWVLYRDNKVSRREKCNGGRLGFYINVAKSLIELAIGIPRPCSANNIHPTAIYYSVCHPDSLQKCCRVCKKKHAAYARPVSVCLFATSHVSQNFTRRKSGPYAFSSDLTLYFMLSVCVE